MKETITKVNKTKSWFFEKMNKIDKPSARLINKISIANGEVTTNNAEIQRIIMNNYMAIKWITWKKWTDSQKSSIFQD